MTGSTRCMWTNSVTKILVPITDRDPLMSSRSRSSLARPVAVPVRSHAASGRLCSSATVAGIGCSGDWAVCIGDVCQTCGLEGDAAAVIRVSCRSSSDHTGKVTGTNSIGGRTTESLPGVLAFNTAFGQRQAA